MGADTLIGNDAYNVAEEGLGTIKVGFDKDHWPVMADSTWVSTLHNFYGVKSTGRVQ
jgi:hypothetical protein